MGKFFNQERKDVARANFLARNLKAMGSPTDGNFAYEIWEILSSHMSPVPYFVACKLYLKAGYKPFMGYPLTHKG